MIKQKDFEKVVIDHFLQEISKPNIMIKMTGAFVAQKENAGALFYSIVIPACIFCTVRLRNFYKCNICLWLTVLVAGYPDEQKRELGSTLFLRVADDRGFCCAKRKCRETLFFYRYPCLHFLHRSPA